MVEGSVVSDRKSSVRLTLALHSRCLPGTDSEVISMVTQRSKNTEPKRENIRRMRMNLKQGVRIEVKVGFDVSIPVLVKDQNQRPDDKQHQAAEFADSKSPRYSGKIVEKDVGQRRIGVHIGNTVVDNHHDDGGDPGGGEEVDQCHHRLPGFGLEFGLPVVMVVVMTVVVAVMVTMGPSSGQWLTSADRRLAPSTRGRRWCHQRRVGGGHQRGQL